MTQRDDKLVRLESAANAIGYQAYEDLENQAKLVASNLLLQYGDKTCLSGTGFIYSLITAYATQLAWLLAEGYVTLTDKAEATAEETAERLEKKQKPELAAVVGSPRSADAAYL
jgi:hypothetical protein